MTRSPDPLDGILDLPLNDLPPATLDRTRHYLLDLLGVAAGATRTPLAEHARRFAMAQHGGDRPLLFAKGRASSTGAALHGAWLIDALDAHDGQVLTKGHVGVALLPGLLALPDIEQCSGKEFLGLIALGYEVATRAGIALHATSPDYHTSGAWNALGVAAVAGRVMGLDRARLNHALGIAEFYGPRSQMMRCIDYPTMLKDGSGWGAMTGISAALLAREGFTGAPALTITAPEVAGIWQDLGERQYLHEQYLKAYPVCRWAQPAVEAVLSLPAPLPTSAEITRVEILTFHEARRLHVVHPETTEQAQYSLPWSVACALARGTVDTGAVTHLEADDIKRLASRIEIHEREDFNACFPAERWAQARLHLSDGRTLSSQPCEVLGNPHNPLSEQDIQAKYRSLAEPVLGGRSETLREVVSDLEARPLSDLLSLLGPAS
ncbi:MmgE/PrpD family protein [Halomonas almeriensis]|uniref:MmgE/PrpD family protein n=1 Tax=Halomonas almeriensis TaxID=308163 RepID=UPI0025B388A5|nr:MmgE/PrpD family protein [Halomonas almeriensis]MDN3552654.1 MmgE/PrpD family protein [Halomonas almeriensis]